MGVGQGAETGGDSVDHITRFDHPVDQLPGGPKTLGQVVYRSGIGASIRHVDDLLRSERATINYDCFHGPRR